MQRRILVLAALLVGLVCLVVGARPARAETLERALALFKAQSHAPAALALYDVLAHDPSADRRDQAQIYLAETLKKLELYVPSLFYYQDLLKAGRANRFYLHALQGLLDLQDDLHDQVFIPILIDGAFDPAGFGQLDPAHIAHINYLVGELSFRRGKNDDAKLFLDYVAPTSPHYAKARYLLGILAVRQNKSEDALAIFSALVTRLEAVDTSDALPLAAARGSLRDALAAANPTEAAPSEVTPDEDDDASDLRALSLIAAGRVAYGVGRYAEAEAYYARVPRYGRHWFTSLAELGWAHFRLSEYGKVLGDLQTVLSPVFRRHHRPEAYVVQALAYFVNCQWDRVRRSVDTFKLGYEPMLAMLKAYLAQDRAPVDYYRDVVRGGNKRFALEIAREVRRNKRFLDYHFMLEHMAFERTQAQELEGWRGTPLAEVALAIIDAQREQLEPVVGTWAKRRLVYLRDQLVNLQNQVNIIDFEVTDSERLWLEKGKEIAKGRRARLPRPEIPNDQWQHWSFDGEYWRDEAGYLQHALQSECY